MNVFGLSNGVVMYISYFPGSTVWKYALPAVSVNAVICCPVSLEIICIVAPGYGVLCTTYIDVSVVSISPSVTGRSVRTIIDRSRIFFMSLL